MVAQFNEFRLAQKTETARNKPWDHCTLYPTRFPFNNVRWVIARRFEVVKIMIKSLNNATNGCLWALVMWQETTQKWNEYAPCFLREDNDLFQVRVAPCRDRVAETTSQKNWNQCLTCFLFLDHFAGTDARCSRLRSASYGDVQGWRNEHQNPLQQSLQRRSSCARL